MAALNVLTTAPTTEDPSAIDCWYGAAPRFVCEVLISTAVVTVTPYRYSPDLGKWIASSAGAASLAVGAGEVRVDDGGFPAHRCLVRSTGTGTGIYYPKGGR